MLTDDKMTQRRRVASFSRSSTEPSLPRLKREASELSLSAVPSLDSKPRRFSQREVDLRAVSQATENRIKKKARIESELQNAISVLKKPNARMAVKDLVDAADHRVTDSQSRKVSHSKRNPLAPQVTATPSKEKPIVVVPAVQACFQTSLQPQPTTLVAPDPQILGVPCSSSKPLVTGNGPSAHREIDHFPINLVEATPSRGPEKFRPMARLAQLPFPMTSRANAELRPSVGTGSRTILQSTGTPRREVVAQNTRSFGDEPTDLMMPIEETPVKARKVPVAAVNVKPTPSKLQTWLNPVRFGVLRYEKPLPEEPAAPLDEDCNDDVDLL